jgi:recombination protein RecA
MSSATALRFEIERSLERRFPSALTPAPRAALEVASTGIPAVDELLDGGLPVGAISEIIGPQCSGRTSLAYSFLAQRTKEGYACAWVDASDGFDPESAVASGVALPQLLWVRCKDAAQIKGKPWNRLDQALRATDLLLQAAGFGAIVLDLAQTASEHGRRIPLATWFRFRQAANRSRTSLVVLGQDSYAQSSAEAVLESSLSHDPTPGQTVLEGLRFEVRRRRRRFEHSTLTARKPPASTWSASSSWSEVSRP